MPPKQKITKEMILEKSYELVKTNGIEIVNSRNIAKLLSCSTQPIFSQFPLMEKLRKEVYVYSCQKFENEILMEKDNKDFIRMSYLKVINLARSEKNLFRLIYLSEYCSSENLMADRMNYESNHKLFDGIKKRYELDDDSCRDILQRSSLMVQGIATLIATTHINYTDEEVIAIIEQTVLDMVNGILEREENRK